jgi:hypothetical protein
LRRLLDDGAGRGRPAPEEHREITEADIEALRGLGRTPGRDHRRCRPLDLDALGRIVSDAVDPTVARPLIVDRVLGTLTGLFDPMLAPPEFEPELDIPLWKFLDDYERDWLLPGVSDLPDNAVVAVQSNPAFIEALLVGVNTQTASELRWRNLPLRTGWTPLRRFWLRIGGSKPANDIIGVKAWAPGTVFGDPQHLPDPTSGANLAVVFRTQLFKRYPSTHVYLVAKEMPDPQWTQLPEVDDPTKPDFEPRVDPTFTGTIGPDVTFFGFPLPPSSGSDHWVVLEEPPPGVRFYTQPPFDETDPAEKQKFLDWITARDSAGNGAEFATATFARPVRAFLGALIG